MSCHFYNLDWTWAIRTPGMTTAGWANKTELWTCRAEDTPKLRLPFTGSCLEKPADLWLLTPSWWWSFQIRKPIIQTTGPYHATRDHFLLENILLHRVIPVLVIVTQHVHNADSFNMHFFTPCPTVCLLSTLSSREHLTCTLCLVLMSRTGKRYHHIRKLSGYLLTPSTHVPCDPANPSPVHNRNAYTMFTKSHVQDSSQQHYCCGPKLETTQISLTAGISK